MIRQRLHVVALAAALAVTGTAQAQAPKQVVRGPLAQAWIDVATYSGMGMPMAGGGGVNPMASIGNLFGGGGGSAKNQFGHTHTGSAGRWVDVTLFARQGPLPEATQDVPGSFMNSALKLQPPKQAQRAPETQDDQVIEHDVERPRGKLLLYWGCGTTVRPGQPKVLDMATATVADQSAFFQARRATQRGAHSAAGRPVWPSIDDARMVPANASLVGQHAFAGAGVPQGFRFQIPAAQDLMPALAVKQQPRDGATELSWSALPTARAYFIAGMGSNEREEMVIWTSSERPDSGSGLVDYQTNPAVDRWLGEKVLLSATTTQCAVPKGVFPEGTGGMLRMIAYGDELNLVHPPRPKDPKVPWEQEWTTKIRVKSVANLMLGMSDEMPGMGESRPRRGGAAPDADKREDAREEKKKEDEGKLKPLDLLRGILGR